MKKYAKLDGKEIESHSISKVGEIVAFPRNKNKGYYFDIFFKENIPTYRVQRPTNAITTANYKLEEIQKLRNDFLEVL